MDWREVLNYRPKGHAALGRSTFPKPPALPEVADSRKNISHFHEADFFRIGNCGEDRKSAFDLSQNHALGFV